MAPDDRDRLNDRLVGTWRLVAFVGQDADGQKTAKFGPKPLGYLTYDARGRMSVHVTRSDRRSFRSGASAASPEELREAFEGYFGYFGTYTVDENEGTVTHHVEGASHPDYAGTDQRRVIAWQGNRLVLSTPPEGTAGPDVTYVATWQREP